ncbi:DUF3040 domain-containing protein [Pseudonocardia sp.]|uniref:DUF3040 domain-containing protein n=1 Tax=Pseudonocardia sp. TaxID=60912 RepID=UPI003D0EAE33
MAPDDDLRAAWLAQIERQLAREEPELAAALAQMRPPERRRPPRRAWLVLVCGVLAVVLSLVLGSVAWAILAVIVAGCAWCIVHGLETESRPRR